MRRKLEESLKGHLEEIASSIAYQASKPALEIEVQWLEELRERFEKVILALHRYKEGEETEAKEILKEIIW